MLTDRDTKGLFTLLTSDAKPCRLFSWRNFPAATRVWIKINYGDESTSSQTFNYFLCMFSRKSLFLFSQLKILTGTELVENFKISVSKRLGRGTHSQNRNEPNAQNKNFFRIKYVKVLLQNSNSDMQLAISPSLAQPVNRAASTTEHHHKNTSYKIVELCKK